MYSVNGVTKWMKEVGYEGNLFSSYTRMEQKAIIPEYLATKGYVVIPAGKEGYIFIELFCTREYVRAPFMRVDYVRLGSKNYYDALLEGLKIIGTKGKNNGKS